MDWSASASAFLVVFLAELGDNTQLSNTPEKRSHPDTRQTDRAAPPEEVDGEMPTSFMKLWRLSKRRGFAFLRPVPKGP